MGLQRPFFSSNLHHICRLRFTKRVLSCSRRAPFFDSLSPPSRGLCFFTPLGLRDTSINVFFLAPESHLIVCIGNSRSPLCYPQTSTMEPRWGCADSSMSFVDSSSLASAAPCSSRASLAMTATRVLTSRLSC